ncbi:unnamed protein product [Ceratitis capitata]|uniref:(Mediterranean fruit fly) hypothetical protein n=1 Tax=Ceratitis capitata TaxID=7213 RepID=A0A811VD25_CERCA|nr:unnamed protein product [Ceratitis capitata]
MIKFGAIENTTKENKVRNENEMQVTNLPFCWLNAADFEQRTPMHIQLSVGTYTHTVESKNWYGISKYLQMLVLTHKAQKEILLNFVFLQFHFKIFAFHVCFSSSGQQLPKGHANMKMHTTQMRSWAKYTVL